MDAPKYDPPPPDPTVTALNERAKQDDALAAQQTAQIDTASLMARYGTRLAMAGGGGGASPLAAPSGPSFGGFGGLGGFGGRG